MDPYEFTQTVNHEVHENEEDDLQKLEKDLAPSSADYYGVLNIARKVCQCAHFIWLSTERFVFYRPRMRKLKIHTRNYAVSSIQTKYGSVFGPKFSQFLIKLFSRSIPMKRKKRKQSLDSKLFKRHMKV